MTRGVVSGILLLLLTSASSVFAQTADFGDFNLFNSASSTVVTTLKIGSTTDKESTATTNATATGDDLTGSDDEDGVTVPVTIQVGAAGSLVVNVSNTTGSTAYLNAWIDWNDNGNITSAGSQIATNITVASGTSNSNRTLNFTVPSSAVLGTVGVRVRLTSVSSPGTDGADGNGEVEDHMLTIVPNTDFGDYGLFASATQVANSNIRIGTNATDTEASNPGSTTATEDSTTGVNDEDLVMPMIITAGTSTTLAIPVTVNAASLSGSTARIRVFADWNGDNDVADTNETLATQTVNISGTYNFTLSPPAGTVAGTKFLRVRISETTATPSFSGSSTLKGEVEDYPIVVGTRDFGDFSLFPSASSTVNTTLRLGATTDVEISDMSDATATGDDTDNLDDENGVTVPASVVLGVAGSLTANVTNSSGSTAYLNAWIDFNRNGVLTDSGEQIATNTTISNGTSNSNRTVSFTVPATAAPGIAGVRVRLTSTSTPGPDGLDGNGEVEDYVMTLACPTVTVSPTTTTTATVGTAYSQTFSASGSSTTFTYAVTSGALPAGLSLDEGTGVLSGTPTSGTAATFTVTATGANGCGSSRAYTITPACPSASLTPATIPVSNMGSAYSQTFTASGGTAPYTYAVSSGTLPTGLSLSPEGMLSGTPTTANGAGANVTIRATDVYGCQVSRSYAVIVCPAITVNPASAASAVVGSAYSQTFSGSGGAAPYTFAVTGGALPGWATLNPSTGVVSGTPNNTTSATFTIRATDANGCQGSRSYTITPTCPTITVNPATLPDGVAGFAYNQTLSGGSGTAPYTFAIISGALPAGLSLNTTSGAITGAPVNGAAGTFTVRATDNYGCTGTRSYTITPVNIEFGDWNGSGAATATASTIRDTNIRLGATVDAEAAAATNAAGTADDLAGTDDEDGVAIPAYLTQGASVTIPVNVFNNNTAGRYLQGWIDFNNDGAFNNTDLASGGERVYNAAVPASAVSQTLNITFTVPAGASVGTQRGARFRFTDNAGTTPTSSGASGETEDYTVTIASPPVAGAAGLAIVQEWFVPQPEAQIREDYLVLAPKVNAITDSVITVTVPIAATKVVFDHWEDGYEVDLKNPTQPSTQIWGDGNDANGKPPGYANDPASFAAGSVITMRNNVTLPRNASTRLYDGRDRLGSTYGIVMTRAAWFTDPGPLLANSVEVRAVNDWGTTFVLPVGEDVIYPTPLAQSMFEHCSAYVMAAQNGTTVQIDKDANGVMETTVMLNMGESYLINSGIKKGARITTSKPAQVIEFFGDINANFETRGANVPPLEKWSSDYYAPVGTAADGDDTHVFLYNPDTAAITINYVTQAGSGSFAIPAKSTYRHLMPQNSAARFTSVGNKPFWGVGTVGAEANQNNVHDWGYALVPKDFLSTVVVVGWGAGSDDGTQNGSPVWVTPTKSTTIYVDYNGDRNGPLTDPSGQKYDVALNASALSVSRVYESDKNQTGTRLYTLDGTNIIGAWGQDPATAGPARPYLDLGNTLPNYPVPVMSKVSSIALDNSPAGPSAGDILEYTITFENKSLFALSTVSIVDILPTAQLAYVRYSTTRDGISVTDKGSTPFPLDEGGLVIPVLNPKESTVIKFRATIIGTGTITNVVSADGIPGVSATDVIVVPVGGSSSLCTLEFTNNTGAAIIYQTGDGIYATVTNNNANTAAGAVETVTASILNNANGDAETITLTETGANTGVFRNTTPLPTSTTAGLSPSDGTLSVQAGHSLTGTHTDGVSGNLCSDTTTIAAPSLIKQLYLDADGAGGDMTGDLDRVDPVVTGDSTTSETATLTTGGASVITAAATTTGSNTSIAIGGTLSFSHTPGSGANRLLLVAVSVGNTTADDADPAPGTVTGVTFGGSAMTQVAAAHSGAAVRTYIYRLVNPSSSAANVVVSIGSKASSVTASATTFTGVHQTTPLGSSSNFVATGGDYFVTGTFASAEDELVYSSVAVDEYSTVNQGVSSGTGQTQLWNSSGFNYVSAASSTKPGATSVSLRYDFLDYEDGVFAAVSIKPAAGTTGSGATWTQTPAFAENFSMPVGGNLGVTAYAEFSVSSPAATPAITATLKNGGTTIATLTSPAATHVSGSSGQPVTLDATSSSRRRAGSGSDSSPTFSSLTWSHTTGTGNNRLLLVGVALESDNQGTTVSSISYSGQSLTRAGFQQSSDNEARMEIWRLINPPSGTANVVVSLNQSCDDAVVAVASTFSGVHQSTPLGTFASAQSDQGDSAPQPSLTLASAAGELVFDMLALDDADTVTAPGGGQTQRLNLTQGDSDSGITGAASTKAGGSSVSMSWATSPDSWALGAVPIKPAASGSSIHRLDWNAALASAVNIASGQSLSLTIENAGETDFSVLYDSSTYPSKVSLPTNTVIHTDSITVYDAPYPGGNATTAPDLGEKVYVRVTVGDPFGAYDITTVPFTIDAPGTASDVSATLTNANVVETTAATKTYQYVWTVGSVEGPVTISATAKEGYENTITSSKSAIVTLSSLDLGTPGFATFTTGLNGGETTTYGLNEQVAVRVTDIDQNLSATVAETLTATITSSGDSEQITLTETGIDTGVFVYLIPVTSSVAGSSDNGTLYVPAGSVLTLSYVDPTDATDISNATATTPALTPAVSVVTTLLSPADGQIIVGETAQYRIRVTNTGNTTLNTVQVADAFPAASLGYVSASVAPSTVAGGSLTWTNVGPLDSGQSVDLLVNFTGLAAASPATNTVNVTTGGGPTASSNAPVIVTRPAVSVTKTLVSPNPGPANKGDEVVFNLTLQNTGTTALSTLPLEDTFSDANFDFVFATISPDSAGAGSLVWNDITDAGSLAVGESITVTVTLRAKGNASPAINTAAVTNAFDANGDPVPPATSAASLQLLAATVSGSVYEDKGTAGFGGGDTGLKDVTVTLYSDPNADGDPADGVVVAITTTDNTGYYEFLNLGAGRYVLVQENLPTYVNVADTSAPNDNRIPVNVTTLTTYPDNNFLDVIPIPLDFGDWNGSGAATITASTVMTTNIRLGETVDDEESVTPDAAATADGDDEDGVIMPATLVQTAVVTIPVNVFNLNTAGRYLQGWIDFDNDGIFNNTDVGGGGERIYNAVVPASASLQTVNITFTVPAGASIGAQRGVRFRFTDSAATTPTSSGAKGETEDYVVAIVAPTLDYGDFSGFSSANSTVNAALKIGALVDVEGSQVTNGSATGDDITGSDDEDGVTMPSSITAGGLVTVPVNVTNNTGAAAYLNAWMDYNNNTAFDVGEQIATNVLVPDGTTGATINVTLDVPTSASVGGGRGMRFRLTNAASPGPTGTSGIGEVEDYVVSITEPTLDHGDFNLFTNASSTANNRLRIGASVDIEGRAMTDATATGDDLHGSDDENGVTIPSAITQGTGSSLTVNVTNTIGSTAYLNAWIDFNGNGVLTDAGEQIASNTAIANSTSNSNRAVNFTVPAVVKTGMVGVRVRLTSNSSPGPDGQDGSGEVEDHMVNIVANTDFGDFSSFPSASSKTNGTLRLGSLTDSEGGLDTDANATADDLDGSDDEDGVIVPAELAQGSASSITVNTSNTSGNSAYLNAWIDFNRNGVLTDAGEQIASNTIITTGTSNINRVLNFTLPVSASLGKAGVRVRLTSVSSPGPDGLDGNGEVEDHTTMIVIPTTDFGDELDLANASSTINSNLRLGALVDAEGSPTKTANADGDDINGSDDEDGLSFPSVTAGQPVSLPVIVTNLTASDAYLNAWIDFNNNGVLTDAGEQIANNVLVTTGTDNGTLTLDFNVPTNAVTAATSLGTRFRLTDIQNPGPTGQAGVGEVEDHPIVILAPLTDFGDFSGAPEVSNTASTNLRLGSLVDTEYASTRNTTATGDDTSGVDDEDGVTLPAMTAGAPATISAVVTNNTGLSAYLNAWIDFNNNGVFTDPGEQVSANLLVATGTSNATRSIGLTVPATAVTGTSLGVRVRLSSDVSPGSTGAGGVGEVEDHIINISPPTTDFGDLASFGSASSTVISTIKLGATTDTEYVQTINATATGDNITAIDDEDAVVFPSMIAGAPATIPVVVTNTSGSAAYLNAWIDFNNNGVLTDAGEQIATNLLIAAGTSNVTQNLSTTVPATTLTGVNLGARFRLTSTASPGATGSSGNGEVEDYVVTVMAPTTDFGDFNGFADASQGANPALRLGASLDAEFASTRNASATGDDASGLDDEDGATLPSMTAGQTVTIPVTITNTTGANGFLNAWFDFNNNGILTDSGEQIASNITIATGTTDSVTNLTFTVPATAVTSTNVGLRFRLSAPSGLGPTGTNALAGEIEDYAVNIAAPTTDFGDHAGLSAATSTVNANLLLGTSVDAEYAAITNTSAMGDDTTGIDDEDGVIVPPSLDPGTTITLPVTVQNRTGANSWLHAWIDFNNDGVLNDAPISSGGERLEAARLIPSLNTGTILREYWTGISGTSVSNLTSSPSYPNSPTSYDYRTSFTAPVDWADNMGQRIRGWIYPPVSGQYTFWISGDDETQLFLSTDETTANTTMIARVPGWTGSLEWTKYAEQKSVKITLEAGKPYYIEGLMKEGTGGDSIAAAWELPGTSTGPVVISGQYLAPWSASSVFKSSQQITFTVPLTVSPGSNRAVRFRLTNSSSTTSSGASGIGEVEDYAVTITSPTNDFSDWSGAANASNGVDSNLFMGATVDAEYLAATNTSATGDDLAGTDDEDGVTLPSFIAGGAFNTPVSVTNLTGSAAYLNAWIDFNNNGVFTDTGEQVVTNLSVATGSNGLTVNPTINVPTTAVTGTNVGVRFRLTANSAPGATGTGGGSGEVEDYVATIAAPTTDQGDFSRFAAASSTSSTALRMGSLTDAEYIATTNLTANGDDTTGSDDEDGVTLPSLMAGAPATIPVVVTNTTGSAAYLNAWIDFNNNGVLTDSGEQVATNVLVATSTTNSTRSLAFTVPSTALTGTSLGLRVRLTSVSSPAATGAAGTGEVEDYITTISPPPLDYGDWNGLADASSTVDPGLRLGTLADTEFASTRNSSASGDDNTESDDEDGIVMPSMIAGAPATIPVLVTNTTGAPAYLNAWFDFNNNGSVADAGEQIATNIVVPTATTNATVSLNLTIPASTVTGASLGTRFRLTSLASPGATGNSGIGEVEDHTANVAVPVTDFGDWSSAADASNIASSDLRMGALADTEYVPTKNSSATGDDTTASDDEDGVTLPLLNPGTSSSAVVVVTNNTGSPGYLNTWIDFNNNGSFADAGEQIATNVVVANGTNGATQNISFVTPINAIPGIRGARFRFTAAQDPSPAGNGGLGEVEDHMVSIACVPFSINPASMPAATVGTAWSQTVSAGGIHPPFVFNITTGTLPAGLTLDSATGVVSGTPTSSAAASFTITGTDANGCTGSRNYTMTPVCPAISITPASLAQGTVGTFYSRTLTASGGTPSYGSWTITSGALPTGLTLNSSTGVISGTPTATASPATSITVRVSDTYGCQGTQTISLQVCPVVTPNPASLPNCTVGTAYNQTVSASGGASPYTFVVSSGSLPPGLSLDASTGAISGIPTSANNATFIIRATDANGCAGTRNYTIVSGCPTLNLAPSTLPSGYFGGSYNQTLTAANGTAPYTYIIHTGALPTGLFLAGNGIISGVPSVTGLFTFTVRATDVYGCSTTFDYTLNVRSLSLGNLVFEDANSNGTKDTGEFGVAGALVQLFATGDDNAIGGSDSAEDTQTGGDVVTTSSGAYLFNLVPPGTYYVKVTPPADYTLTGGTAATTDDDIDNNNDGAQPGGEGTPLFSPVITLTGGAESITDGDTDADTNFTLDFGLWSSVAVGNFVFLDINGDGVRNEGESLGNIFVELYAQGATPGVDEPVSVGSSGCSCKGRYYIEGLNPGDYFLHIPASQFAIGMPLEGLLPMSGVVAGDDDMGQDLLFNSDPALNGVSTAVFSLRPGQCPSGAAESGGEGTIDDEIDGRVDLTRDLGVIAPAGTGFAASERIRRHLVTGGFTATVLPGASTFAIWSQDGSIGSATDDLDEDGLANLLEYALGTDPVNPLHPQRFTLTQDSAGGIVALLTQPVTTRDDIIVKLETLTDLTQAADPAAWKRLSIAAATTFNGDDTLTRQYASLEKLLVFKGLDNGFVRLKIELDANRDGVPEAFVTSAIHAWSRQTFATGTRTFSMPLLKPAVFTGRVRSVSGNEIVLPYILTLPAGSHYLEVVGGTLAGQRFEIDATASSGNTLVLQAAAPSFAALADARVIVRPHHTLGEILHPAAFTAEDRVLFFDNAANNFTTLTHGGDAWLNDILGMNARPFAAHEAALVQVRGPGTILTFTGVVRASNFATPLASGTQLIAPGWPTSIAAPVAGLRSGPTPETADRLRLWNGDTTPESSGYTSYYLDSTTSPPAWIPQDSVPSSFLIPHSSFQLPFHGLFLIRETPLWLHQNAPW